MKAHVQAVRKSKEAFKLQEDAQYGSSPLMPNQKVAFNLTLVQHIIATCNHSCT